MEQKKDAHGLQQRQLSPSLSHHIDCIAEAKLFVIHLFHLLLSPQTQNVAWLHFIPIEYGLGCDQTDLLVGWNLRLSDFK